MLSMSVCPFLLTFRLACTINSNGPLPYAVVIVIILASVATKSTSMSLMPLFS